MKREESEQAVKAQVMFLKADQLATFIDSLIESVPTEFLPTMAKLAINAQAPAPAPAPEKDVRFMWNGIKVDGKLFKAHYSRCVLIGDTEESITVYAREYNHFPDIGDVKIQNESDMMTDYFEKDRMRIAKGSKWWNAAVAAMEKVAAHNAKVRKVLA